ncbi:MAG: hypothetical protein HQ506_01390 [Candidatus Marinimicrobia bacterium]|nr:hypothetical protein [Candidatus Neomarinimicrobiota bacterium]
MIFPSIVPELVDWLEAGQWDKVSLGMLSQRLWSRVSTALKDTPEISPVYKHYVHGAELNLKTVLL